MFYSHEILTSRKHGVATIWLVATLGSKSSLKKVSRRAILDVDVPKACETIADPESPMALRLQSSLLYGVSRVFWQQCGYILADSQSLHDKMRGVSMVMRNMQADSNVALTSDQLNLPNDPGFDFDLDMGLDLSTFNVSSPSAERSSLLSPHSFATSQSSLLPEFGTEQELDFPSMNTPEHEVFDFGLGGTAASSSVHKSAQHILSDLEEPGIDENPFFEINDDGVIVEKPMSHTGPSEPALTSTMRGVEPRAGTQIREQEEGVSSTNVRGAAHANFEDDYVMIGDDDERLPTDVQPQTPIQLPVQLPVFVVANNTGPTAAQTAAPQPEVETFETVVEAPQRRTRPLRLLRADPITEFSNRQLGVWQREYVETMTRARVDTADRQSITQARRNAAFWVLDQGIADVATSFGEERQIHPFNIFSGQTLLESLTGTRCAIGGRKRSHSSVDSQDEDQEEEATTQRARITSGEVLGTRDEQEAFAEDGDGILFQADDEVELQVGRQPASSLKDQPSSMPWNLLGSSHQGSLRGSVQPGISSSLRGIGLDLGPPSVFSGRRSRLTSASPLIGRSRALPRLPSLDPQRDDDAFTLNTGNFADPYAGLTGALVEDFELYGPAAAVGTQQAAQSQWLTAALENEAHNFLLFLGEAIESEAQADDTDAILSITFENLLPPAQNSSIVAAQGLLHVLALATKGLIDVQQDDAFGDIELSIAYHTTEDNDNAERAGSAEQEENA